MDDADDGMMLATAKREAEDDAVATAPDEEEQTAYSVNAIHLVRSTQANTLKLSQMADQKASILMGATFLVFSISVSRSLNGELPIALGLLAVFAFASSMCAVMAVLPSTKRVNIPEEKRNELFFGHFHDHEEEEWTRRVLKILETDEATFRAMLRDIYQNGQVLQHKKYKYLGYAYRIFVTGLIITVVVFALEVGVTQLGSE